MQRIALVLGGGGAKCAFQLGVERYAREVKGIRWCKIAGVSAGALNGAVLASPTPERLMEVWKSLTNEKILGKTSRVLTIKRAISHGYLYENHLLADIIEREIDPSKMVIPMVAGAVSYHDGEYHSIPSTHPDFKKALLASSAYPPAFPPVDVSEDYPAMIDGGVRHVLPIRDVLDADPDHIFIVSASPMTALHQSTVPKNILRRCQRTLEIAMHGNLMGSIGRFLLLNRLAASWAGDSMKSLTGRHYKHYPHTIIAPDERLGDVLDFSPKTIARSIEAGWKKAEQVLSAISFD